LGYPVKVRKAGKEHFYERHVQHLMLLLRADKDDEEHRNDEWPELEEEDTTGADGYTPPAPTPKRRAAVEAEGKIARGYRKKSPVEKGPPRRRGRPPKVKPAVPPVTATTPRKKKLTKKRGESPAWRARRRDENSGSKKVLKK